MQAYTNTGVVHIIAISGLHLGLIYWLLVLLLKPLRKTKLKWLMPVLIISGLWMFSFLAGAQPSILRSALMFTCIVIGENLSRKGSIYNSLALSAFVLLCIDPYWLWDVGFQLSYAAVLSIILFMRPLYNLLYIKNRILDHIWKLNVVTLSAQVLTVPLTIYHFHQFPNYFLFTNLLAVPLSSLVLFGEILLCAFAFIPMAATWVGKIVKGMIQIMNSYVEMIGSIPGAVWHSLEISLSQAILLLFFAVSTAVWLMERLKKCLLAGLIALACFIMLRTFSFLVSDKQEKIIVYNIPQKKAIDLVSGRYYIFIGDSDLILDRSIRNYHLQPTRVRFRMLPGNKQDGAICEQQYIHFKGLQILVLDKQLNFISTEPRPVIDLLILSKDPRIYIRSLVRSLDIRQVVIDGSVPAWRSSYWKKDLDSLNIPWHDVTLSGAFVLNLR